MSTKNKKDIVFGSFELDRDEFSPQNVKVRITTLVDKDALEKFKKMAEAQEWNIKPFSIRSFEALLADQKMAEDLKKI